MATTYTSRTGTHPEEGTKAPCVVATTTNITLSGEQTVNSVAVVAGDRVLVKDQTDTTENGIYLVAVGAWTRATDFNNANDVSSGLIVVDDTNNAVWKCSFTGDYTPGTTAVTFSAVFQLSTPGPASISTTELAANAVTVAKMARATSAHIPIGKGTAADIAYVAVSGDVTITNAGVVTIANDAINTAKIAANAVTVAEMARAISGHISIGKGTAADIAYVAMSGDTTITNTGVVTIANTAVTAAKLAGDAVETAKIKDANVTEAKLSAAVVAKLNATTGDIIHVQHREAVNVAGGDFNNGAWRTRELNTTVSNGITGASLAANQVTLPAGTYYVCGYGTAYNVDRHKTQLYDTTGAASLLLGASASAFSGQQTISQVTGVIILAVESVIELRHRCQTTQATSGFGVAANLVDAEVYADLIIQQMAVG